MDASQRARLLKETDRWRADGLIDDAEHAFLRARYAPADAPTNARADAYATHLVGGLLLGAALVALIQFFAPATLRALIAVATAAACIVGAKQIESRRGEHTAEAIVAAALVTVGSIPFHPHAAWWSALLGAALVVATTLLRAGRTAIALLCVPAFFLTTSHAARVDLLGPSVVAGDPIAIAGAWALLLVLVGYAALLLRLRARGWNSLALAAHGAALAIAVFPALDALGVTDPGVAALGIGATLGLEFVLGAMLDQRPLVIVATAGLTAAAVAFAFLALGPALAAIMLLLLGAVLVWQAEAVKGYVGGVYPAARA